MATQTKTPRDLIIAAVIEAVRIKTAADKLKGRKEGMYSTFTRLAAEHGRDAFEGAVESVFEAIRTNEGGLAVKVGAKPGKKEGTFVVPSSPMTAKSVLLAAFDYKVELLEDGEPRPYGNIRDEVKAARDAEAKAERTPAETLRDEVADRLAEVSGVLLASEEPGVNQCETLRLLLVLVNQAAVAYEHGHRMVLGAEAEDDAEADKAAEAAAKVTKRTRKGGKGAEAQAA